MKQEGSTVFVRQFVDKGPLKKKESSRKKLLLAWQKFDTPNEGPL